MVKTKTKQIKQAVGLHNEFTLAIVEYETEACRKVKKKYEAKAYNVVLTQGLARLAAHMAVNLEGGSFSDYGPCQPMRRTTFDSDENAYCFGGYIAYGSDNTTPAASDTALGSEISRKQSSDASMADSDFANLYAYYTQSIVILPSEHVGSDFKEVGLAGYSSGYLSTRALIVDSEGDPLTISKTSTMQITIYSKLYVTLTDPTQANTDWVNGGSCGFLYGCENNLNWCDWTTGATGTRFQAKWRIYTGTNGTAIDADNDTAVETEAANSGDIRPTRSGTVLTLSHRFGTSSSNGKIKELGVKTFFTGSEGTGGLKSLIRSVMPVTGVYAGTTFTAVEIGTGDGVEDEFTLGETDQESTFWTWNEINETNPTVYIDDVETTAFTYNDTTGVITFTTAPANGEVVTATWSVPYIAKSNDYVLDVEFEFTFGQGTVPS